jgi:hypothetical protein
MQSFVRAELQRRRAAKRRIGVACQLIAASPEAKSLLQAMGLADS